MEKSWGWKYAPVIPVSSGSTKGEDCGPSQPGQKVMPYLPNNQSKKGFDLWIK
jgi:hypothetical protein